MSSDLTKELRRYRTLGSTGTYWENSGVGECRPRKYKAQSPGSAVELAGIEGHIHLRVRIRHGVRSAPVRTQQLTSIGLSQLTVMAATS